MAGLEIELSNAGSFPHAYLKDRRCAKEEELI